MRCFFNSLLVGRGWLAGGGLVNAIRISNHPGEWAPFLPLAWESSGWEPKLIRGFLKMSLRSTTLQARKQFRSTDCRTVNEGGRHIHPWSFQGRWCLLSRDLILASKFHLISSSFMAWSDSLLAFRVFISVRNMNGCYFWKAFRGKCY